MKYLGCFVCLISFAAVVYSQKYPCLDPAISLTDPVSFESTSGKAITVGHKLKTLRARCSHKKLVDRKGRPIRFYQLKGCWGQPPPNYDQVLDRQRKELADLRKKYTVIEITCNSSGLPVQ